MAVGGVLNVGGVGLPGQRLADATLALSDTAVEMLPGARERQGGGGDESLDEEGGDEHGLCGARAEARCRFEGRWGCQVEPWLCSSSSPRLRLYTLHVAVHHSGASERISVLHDATNPFVDEAIC